MTDDPGTSRPPASPRRTVAVLFGGRSGEHGISCVTAAGVLRAIDRTRYDVVPIGITAQGRWVLVEDDASRWEYSAVALPEVKDGDGPEVLPPTEVGSGRFLLREGGSVRPLPPVDVVFPLLHGPFGEDGTLQGLFELADVRYVGAGLLASAANMDKHAMKVLLRAAGLPVGDHLLVTARDWESDPAGVRARVAELGRTVFVKPARAGSSLGITKVDGPDGLDAAILEARRHDPRVVVEAAVVGREIECGVLGSRDGAPATTLPGEIEVIGDHAFYDYEAKYFDPDGVRLSCPADLPDDVTARVRDLAARAFEAMGCEGLARVDLFVTADGSCLINELNTMPGFTPFSQYPRMWGATGVDYPELVERLIRLALDRPVGLR